MGNKTGNVTSIDFNLKQWQITDKQNNQNQNKGNFKVLENIKNGQLIDQYQLYWPNQEDFKFYLDSYYWRRQQYNIVPSKFILQQHSDQFCSRSYGAKVYIQHIPTRLSDVTDIPYPDNLYVALAVLQGYQKLYQNVHHYFPISEDQVCVDRQGVVKVWVNSDLSKNYPEPEQATTQSKDQAHMVDQLLNMIWENTDEESQPQSFRQFFAKKKGKKRIGFDQAKVFVNEYAKNVACQIPQKFNSILQMIDESDYQQNQQQQHYEDENDNQLRNVQVQHNYEHHEQYMNGQGHQYPYNHEGNYQQGQQQGQYYDDEGQQQGYYQHYLPPQHQGQHIIYQQQPNYYHQPLNQIPQYNIPPSIPHAVNPLFVPRQVNTQSRPLISIPPIRSNVTHFNAPNVIQTFNPVIYQNHQLPYQNFIAPHQIIQGQQMYVQQNNRNEARQQSLKIQPFSNTNIAFEQHISTLNPQSGSSSHHAHQQADINQNQQYSSRQQINNSVGRSLQMINQSSKKISETQNIRVNKSHINQSGEGVHVNYPRQYDEGQAFNSRISGTGSRLGDTGERHERNVEELHYIREELMDTKYYTIDTQVELDEEIAADLKKMIMAL